MLTQETYAARRTEKQAITTETLKEKLQQAQHDYDYALKIYNDACATEDNLIILDCRALTCGALLVDLRKTEAEIINNLCQTGNIKSLKEMLSTQENPKIYLKKIAPEALHISCAQNQIHMADYLLTELKLTQEKDPYGYYPIHYACLLENEKRTGLLLDMLIQEGASIDESIGAHNDTPLHTAASCGNQKAARYLIGQGANHLLTNHRGFSALQEALLHGHTKIAIFLNREGSVLSAIECFELQKRMQSNPRANEYLKPFLAPCVAIKPLVFTHSASDPQTIPKTHATSQTDPTPVTRGPTISV